MSAPPSRTEVTRGERIEAERRAELERRLRLVALFVPTTWISLRYTSIASIICVQPFIVVTAPQE
jgi:hypothetical protein